MIKPGYQQPIDKATFDKAIEMLESNLKLLHPFMPFLTEEIWHLIADRTPESRCRIVARARAPRTHRVVRRIAVGEGCRARLPTRRTKATMTAPGRRSRS